ncbi:MAG: family 43 glycosylhydrolase [Treponema sp.]|nr:family 43 glycosylhydrolase [Treponema sp.]
MKTTPPRFVLGTKGKTHLSWRIRHAAAALLAAGILVLGCSSSSGGSSSNGDDNASVVTKISLNTKNVTTNTYVGYNFSAQGLIVTATYKDNTKKTIDISECTFKIGDTNCISGQTKLSSAGKFTVTVTYKMKSASYSLVVSESDKNSQIPLYKDNYIDVSSWGNKGSWNLANTHDPTVFKWTDGYWYMFGTDASYGDEHAKATSGKHFQGKRSKDLVNWEWVPGIMDEAPDWIVDKLNEYRAQMNVPTLKKSEISWGFWAPCARVFDGKVRMYYSIVVDNYIKTGKKNTEANYDGSWTERAFIGVAETTNPNGGPSAWEDKGFVVCSSSDKNLDYSRSGTNDWKAYFYFNAIDPTYFIDDDGTHWMVYGSWHSGFALVQINPSTGKVTKDGKTDFEMGVPWGSNAAELEKNGYGKRIFSRGTSRWQPAEGPELVKYDGYYWLFFANDGLDVPYQTRVVRAKTIKGPYYAIEGSKMTNDVDGKRNGSTNIYPIVTHPYKFNNDDNGFGSCYGWVGISHCAIFNDGDDWYYMSQQRLPENVAGNPYSNAIMMGGVRKLVWTPKNVGSSELWPMVLPERYGGLTNEYDVPVIKSDIPGTWQHINLVYAYGKMDIAKELILTDSGTMSGALEGTWSLDEKTQQLTFAPKNGTPFVVTVARECDWEANPRTSTIVYTGTVNDGAQSCTYWGKKDKHGSYEDLFKNAKLQSTYTMTVADNAKNDLAWYIYAQIGDYTIATDDESETIKGAGDWWKNGPESKSTKRIVSPGQDLTLYVITASPNTGIVLEGYSETAGTYVTINPHATTDKTNGGKWGDAVTAWGDSTDKRTSLPYTEMSLKIIISNYGSKQIVSIYKL